MNRYVVFFTPNNKALEDILLEIDRERHNSPAVEEKARMCGINPSGDSFASRKGLDRCRVPDGSDLARKRSGSIKKKRKKRALVEARTPEAREWSSGIAGGQRGGRKERFAHTRKRMRRRSERTARNEIQERSRRSEHIGSARGTTGPPTPSDAAGKEVRDTGSEMARSKKTRLETCFDLGGTLTWSHRMCRWTEAGPTCQLGPAAVCLGAPSRSVAQSRGRQARCRNRVVHGRGAGY